MPMIEEARRLGFLEALVARPLVLDAALGTRLIGRGLNLLDDDPALWNLSHPEAVAEVHSRDVAAGSDVLLANTFGANRSWLDRYGRGRESGPINRAAVALARRVIGDKGYVLGSIGPTAGGIALIEQAEALEDAGVDGLIFETHSAERAILSLAALQGRPTLPIVVSLVAWPENLGESARRLEDLGASLLGANCQDGPEETRAILEKLSNVTTLPLLAKPSAGLPGQPMAGPERFAAAVPRWLDCGARLLGGCCGTTEAHVAAIRKACYDRRDNPYERREPLLHLRSEGPSP